MAQEYKYDVSVVIPVYGVEAFIERCACSLFEQSLKKGIEFIFVDDCTVDNSIEVLESVLKRYPERVEDVKILHQPRNMGVSMARQRGVDAALGEYIIHCDPDDMVEYDMYSVLLDEAHRTGADIVVCDFQTIDDGGVNVVQQDPKSQSSMSLLGGISGATSQKLHGSLWNKLICSRCYAAVSFPPEGMNYCEDVFVMFQICSLPDIRVAYVPHALYSYCDRASSLIYNVGQSSLDMSQQMVELMFNMFRERADILPFVRAFSVGIMFRAFEHWHLSSAEFRRGYKKYQRNIAVNKQVRPMLRLVMFVACSFNHRVAKFMWHSFEKCIPYLSPIKRKLSVIIR
jgi:glycosyltransferase involved in cell wall biosynthesis